MITVVADNPSMGTTYRMPAALAPLAKDGLVKTVVRQLDGWREWGADVVIGGPGRSDEDYDAVLATALDVVDRADWILVMGISGLDVLHDITGGMVPAAPLVIYHVESFYRGERAAAFNTNMEGAFVATFAMPDLWAGGQCPPGTVPLLQPMIVPEAPPRKSAFYLVHSPGTAKKAKAKGTDTIEDGVALAAESIGRECAFDSLMGESHRDVLATKAHAHICIDQVPDDGLPTGLGNSGCEGLALACHTISRYAVDTSAYFPNPPVAYAENAKDVARAILDYWVLSDRRRTTKRRQAWEWAKANLDLGSEPAGGTWLAYFRKHLPPAILERCM